MASSRWQRRRSPTDFSDRRPAYLGLALKGKGHRRLKRRLDRQERVREALLLDLGAVVFELHRQRRREPELLQSKADELRAVDDEVRGLADALDEGETLTTLTATGLVATCTACRRLMGTRDRFCPSCGAAAGSSERVHDERPEPMEPPDFGETEEFNVVKAMAEEEAAVAKAAAEPARPAAEPVAARAAGPDAARAAEPAAAPSSPAPAAQALVPRAQRRMRAGRRIARQWLAQRRSDGP